MDKIRQFQWKQFARHPGDLAQVNAHSSVPILITKIISHITQYTHMRGGLYAHVCGLQNMQVKRCVAVFKRFQKWAANNPDQCWQGAAAATTAVRV